jgi:hypothetical protein
MEAGMLNLRLYWLAVVAVFILAACAPISVNKCYEEFSYDDSGRVKKVYKECIQQVPEKTSPIHLKNKELYD